MENFNNAQRLPLKSCMKIKTHEESLATCRVGISNRSSLSRMSFKIFLEVEEIVRRASTLGRRASTLFHKRENEDTALNDKSNRTYESEETQIICSNSKKVVFSFIAVRNYDLVASDNPSVTRGPALALGWDYEFEPLKKVEDFELEREKSRQPMEQLKIGEEERIRMLRKAGFSTKEIQKATARSNKARNLRRRTLIKVNNAIKNGRLNELDDRRPLLKMIRNGLKTFLISKKPPIKVC